MFGNQITLDNNRETKLARQGVRCAQKPDGYVQCNVI
uniref:Uncharacterized protein n=1 Tax=Schistosoma haematobium TaxID=6185 RepID=A0A095C4W7_SCHHA